jgi:hypothetical protein
MPRTRSLAWTELKIGILTVVALVAAGLLVFAVGGEGGFFWQRYPLKARFTNIATVRAGTPVRLAGIEVGAVTDVQFAGQSVDAWFEVAKNVRPLVTDGSTVTIGSVSMLGEGALDRRHADPRLGLRAIDRRARFADRLDRFGRDRPGGNQPAAGRHSRRQRHTRAAGH